MHHGKHVRRLNRNSAHRNSLLRNLVSSLISSGRIETTVAKAKELQPIAERLITLAKKGDSNAKRHACSYLYVMTASKNRSPSDLLTSDAYVSYIIIEPRCHYSKTIRRTCASVCESTGRIYTCEADWQPVR